MYKHLRRIRIIVSALFLAMLTLCIVDNAVCWTPIGQWVLSTQLVPAILAGSAVWIVLWVLITILFGRVYCSSVCPIGTLQDAAAYVGHKVGKGAKGRYKYMPTSYHLRIAIALCVAACLFGGLTMVVRATDPFSVYNKIVLTVAHPAAVGLGSLGLALLFLCIISAVAWRKGRLLCNSLCPAGALLGLLSRQPIYRVDINTDKCIHCGKCEDVCKSSCINLKDCTVDNSRCVMCMDCTAICPNDAITVRKGRHKLSTPMMQRSC